MREIAQLLEGARQGDRQAIDELFATLYGEFRTIAHGAHSMLGEHYRAPLRDLQARLAAPR